MADEPHPNQIEPDGSTRSGAPVADRDPEAVIRLLRAWCVEDADEQRETWEFLRRALDEDRLSDRKLFP